MKRENIFKMVLAAFFLALAYVLPFLTGQIPEIGNMLCPMHIPVLLCGFICGWKWGLCIGFIAPITRSLIFQAPPLFPKAICFAFEFAAYGLIAGLLFMLLPRKRIFIYVSLIVAMIVGRLVWGLAMFICVVGIKGGAFGFSLFLTESVVNAIPGIIVQIVLIPIIMMVYQRLRIKNGSAY